MATRLSIITTRTGDQGSTGLADGSRRDKDDLRIAALGDVDELNSVIGLWRAEPLPADIDGLLKQVQNDLFDMGAELAIPGHTALTQAHIARLEERLTHYNAGLPTLAEFILPGGTRAASLAHLARTTCRRAERTVVSLRRAEDFALASQQYLNRLSDLCFVLARCLNRYADHPDTLWQR
ncbi:cob(I)yrinic acid a,c-diamide adenosyltransferase [Paracandidimonas soli]|uniref:cob(I)yrinic acid a,c-diamide adenosyltransferase n=1 Tax=Paracandidimonas soli TaxID=1917182 RepID=UPI0033425ECD